MKWLKMPWHHRRFNPSASCPMCKHLGREGRDLMDSRLKAKQTHGEIIRWRGKPAHLFHAPCPTPAPTC